MGSLDEKLGAIANSPREEHLRQILLVDDTPANLQVLFRALADLDLRLLAAQSGARALELAKKNKPSLVLLDVMMPEMDGFEVCEKLKADPELADVPVIFCSALDDTASKVRGFEVGGADFIAKPYQPEEVVARVTTHLALAQLLSDLHTKNNALERELLVASEFRKAALETMSVSLRGDSPATQTLRAGISAQSRSSAPLLLLAEPGCGPEAVARAIHEASDRRDGPFVVLDCELLSGKTGLLSTTASGESEGRVSKLELARGGTLYLDDVFRLPAKAQEHLFELLTPSSRNAGADVRIICFALAPSVAGTVAVDFHPQLERALRRNVLHLPALVERQEDLPELIEHFVREQCLRLGRVRLEIDQEQREALCTYPWPGNLRELEEVLRKSVRASHGERLQVDPRLLEPGTPLGNYRLRTLLGQGSMGEVWEATHQTLARPVAIKLIKSCEGDRVAIERRLRRFKREAEVTARLTSRNTIEIYNFGVSSDGDFYYVMELLDGIDLQDAVRRFGPLPPERAVFLLYQAAASLVEAHAAGIVHRDIKPANLFVCRQGLEVDILKVLDFGMVSIPDEETDTQLTRDGALGGTPSYMAPEATKGLKHFSPKSDVYALGCVAFWLVTGRLVFEASSMMQMLFKHVSEAPPSLVEVGAPDVPLELKELISRCLSKTEEERPSALELWTALERIKTETVWTSQQAREWWTTYRPQGDSDQRAENSFEETNY